MPLSLRVGSVSNAKFYLAVSALCLVCPCDRPNSPQPNLKRGMYVATHTISSPNISTNCATKQQYNNHDERARNNPTYPTAKVSQPSLACKRYSFWSVAITKYRDHSQTKDKTNLKPCEISVGNSGK